MDWSNIKAAIYRGNRGILKPVRDIDYVDIDSLIGISRQKDMLLKNTKNFIENKMASHTLLWGERGCGKSSLIKAVFTKFVGNNLRIIEISKDDLVNLADIIDEIRDEKEYRFIIFCDDLSFEDSDISYKYLKVVLEGSIEKTPSNVLIYATSNRRHLIKELKKDNEDTTILDGEIHYGDAVEEKLSLSDRFGLWISFYQGSYSEYLKIIDSYFNGYEVDRSKLHEEAKKFAMLRGSRSGRTAKQFFINYKKALSE
ncbi:ATP-binding protein (AAA, DUF815 domains) [Campylobacter blaseri]|uniref:ATP-binding protein n=1 Tax=Campylobacter blaseri TaxID=2042961 RepID=A0A2P8R1Z6_9BACT|nr:ATP-binding protein [Campylobacter blaseri]PSM52513.1 ATP-binding protein [Campylobacter blaseri]PSM54161.1 ATP-binding protein [Campylobacter blaseri]QKF85810.1 ATP-binding protein (AAA, DUF815 domains) [Campylobacter blaseri]